MPPSAIATMRRTNGAGNSNFPAMRPQIHKVLSERCSEERVQKGWNKTYHKDIAPRVAHLCGTMLDVVEFQKDYIQMDRLAAFVLVVVQDHFDR